MVNGLGEGLLAFKASGCQALLLDELPYALDQVQVGGVTGQEQQLHLQGARQRLHHRAGLLARVVQHQGDRAAQARGRDLPQPRADRLGVDGGMAGHPDPRVGDRIQRRQDVGTLAAGRPGQEQPYQAPQIPQERPEHERRRIDKQDGPLAPLGFFPPRKQLVGETRGLRAGVGLGRNGPYLAPAQANFFSKQARTWDKPRRMPVRRSMACWASRALRGGFARK